MDGQDMAVFKNVGSAGVDVKVEGNEFRRILHFYQQKWVFYFSIFCSMAGGILPLTMMISMGGSFDAILDPSNFLPVFVSYLAQVGYMIVAMCFIMGLSFGLRGYSNPMFVKDLRNAIFKNIIEQDIEYFDETSSGVLMARLSEDVSFVLNTYVEKLMNAIQYATQVVAGIVIGFVYSWRISLVCFAIVPIAILLYYFGEYYVSKEWLKFRDASAFLAGKAEEIITGFRTVKSFDNEIFEADEYAKGLNNIHKIVIRTSKIHAVKNSLMYFFSWGIVTPLIYYGSYCVIKKPQYGILPGDVVILIGVFGNIGISVAQCVTVVDDMRKAAISAAKLLLVVDRKPNVDRKVGKTLKDVKGKITFKDVSFKYKTREDYAVEHLDFTINAGETVALVGESGCGKSTTLQLLQRFYEIQSGEILIDDVNIQEYSPYSIRKQIAIVPQGPVLFTMSVLDNIRFGKPKAKENDVIQASQIGNAHNFIMELPSNYQQEVQQMSLSGGQKQRICISRAILANTPILLLDEATAALDTESEQLVQQSLEQYRHGKTAIIVAHRLATVKNADRILVFQNGHIAESGTHEELLKRSGIYSDLVKFQLQ